MEPEFTPKPLHGALDYICSAAPGNITVRTLNKLDDNGISEYGRKIEDISKILKKMHMHKFTPLVRSERQASTAVVLYAGDGIVVKITDRSHLPEKFLPCQLPPMRRYFVDGMAVEIYPWIDTHAIERKDLEDVQKELKTYGLEFKKGDDRLENIGRMPNGQCAVLDGNAIDFQIHEREMMNVNRWLDKMFNIFNPLYTAELVEGHEIRLVSENPDFNLRFSPLITPTSRVQTVLASQEVASVPPTSVRRGFLGLFQRGDRGREGTNG